MDQTDQVLYYFYLMTEIVPASETLRASSMPRVKFTPEQATKVQSESRGIALATLSLTSTLDGVGERHAPAALHPGKRAGTHCIGG